MSSTLICYDGSPSAQHALALAHRSLDRRPKLLLTVWSPPARVYPDSFGLDEQSDGVSDSRLCEMVEHAARESAEQGQVRAAELGLEVQVRVERDHSTVPQTILDVANELDSDMILVGTHGMTAMQPRLLGSVSAAIANQSHRPVLLVPTPDARAGAALGEAVARGEA